MTNAETDQQYSVQAIDGSTFGPVDLNQLKTWASERRLNPEDSIVFQDGSPPVTARDWPPIQGYLKGSSGENAIATVIPYRNKCALIGYYLGIFSIFPVLGLPMAIAGLILGIKGLSYRKRNPEAHGKAHAIVAILGSILGLTINLFIWMGMIGMMLSN